MQPAFVAHLTKELPMTTQGFVASHAKDAAFERGLRSFFEYRDLGIRAATQGRVAAHVIRAAAGKEFSSQPHFHQTEFQLVYILKGWIEFEYEGQGVVRLEADRAFTNRRAFATASSATAMTLKCWRSCSRRASPLKRSRRSTAISPQAAMEAWSLAIGCRQHFPFAHEKHAD
jgi:hypothetical protein